MTQIKKVNLSLKITELEAEIIENIVNHYNKNLFSKNSKSNVIREILLKEYINIHQESFNDLEADINDREEILKIIQELGVNNID